MEFQRTQGALLGFSINEYCEVLRVSGQAKQIGLQIKARILQVCGYSLGTLVLWLAFDISSIPFSIITLPRNQITYNALKFELYTYVGG